MEEARLRELLAKFDRARVLVVGDIYLDQYTFGAMTGISLEAPIPIYEVHRRRHNPGAAGNAACNVAALGAKTYMIGYVGDDANADIVRKEFAVRHVDTSGVVVHPTRPTNTYGKMIAGGFNIPEQEVLRVDTPKPTFIEPEIEGEYLYFVGLSEMHATEQKARDAGMRNAVNNIVGYLGTTVKDKFESIITRFGLSSEIADPTTASRQYEQQVKENIANSVKAKEWYIEQWQTKNKQIYWKTYLLARVPKSSIEQSLQNETAKAKDKLKDALDKATNEKAKQQFNDALSAFEAMEKSGLVK